MYSLDLHILGCVLNVLFFLVNWDYIVENTKEYTNQGRLTSVSMICALGPLLMGIMIGMYIYEKITGKNIGE